MNKKSRRALSLLLSILLCLSLLPVTALAAGDEGERVSSAEASSGAKKHSVPNLMKPRFTLQPKSKTAKQGAKVTFKVAAKGYQVKYQWYYRKNASSSWKKLSGKTSPTLTVTAGRNSGCQYRCRATNVSGSTYSKTATLKVNLVRYRALLVGQTYQNGSQARIPAENDLGLMSEMLNSVRGAMGTCYTVTEKYDRSSQEIYRDIKEAFGDADSNDVSLFYFSGHGVSSLGADDFNAGALCTVEGSGSGLLPLYDLAWWLRGVEGKVIVMIDSCGSGAAIYKNGISGTARNSAAGFNSSVINAFAAADVAVPGEDPASNAGDFRKSKFYVLTAADHMENSASWVLGDDLECGMFTSIVAIGAYNDGGMAADANGNGKLTLNELYNFVMAYQQDQHVQVYPANSSYELFKAA